MRVAHITRMTGLDCVVTRNLINTHTHTHIKKAAIRKWRGQHKAPESQRDCMERIYIFVSYQRCSWQQSSMSSWGDQIRVTYFKMISTTGPDNAVNII